MTTTDVRSARDLQAEQREQTRARIVEAAIEAFAEHGFDGAATRDIVARADTSQGLVSYHFETKADLWRAAADHIFGDVEDSLGLENGDEVLNPEVAREAIRSFVRLMPAAPSSSTSWPTPAAATTNACSTWWTTTSLAGWATSAASPTATWTLRTSTRWPARPHCCSVWPPRSRAHRRGPCHEAVIERHADYVAHLFVHDRTQQMIVLPAWIHTARCITLANQLAGLAGFRATPWHANGTAPPQRGRGRRWWCGGRRCVPPAPPGSSAVARTPSAHRGDHVARCRAGGPAPVHREHHEARPGAGPLPPPRRDRPGHGVPPARSDLAASTENRWEELRRTAAMARYLGVDHRDQRRRDRRTVPFATEDLHGGIWLPEDGVVGLSDCTMALVRGARQQGPSGRASVSPRCWSTKGPPVLTALKPPVSGPTAAPRSWPTTSCWPVACGRSTWPAPLAWTCR